MPMTGGLCAHENDPNACPQCQPPSWRAMIRGYPPAWRPAEYGPWFPAPFDGDCDGDGRLICEGDMIRSDGEGGYLCQYCGADDG